MARPPFNIWIEKYLVQQLNRTRWVKQQCAWFKNMSCALESRIPEWLIQILYNDFFLIQLWARACESNQITAFIMCEWEIDNKLFLRRNHIYKSSSTINQSNMWYLSHENHQIKFKVRWQKFNMKKNKFWSKSILTWRLNHSHWKHYTGIQERFK